jgi:hypothetical protein
MIVLVVRIDVCEMRDKENLCCAKTTLALALSLQGSRGGVSRPMVGQ